MGRRLAFPDPDLVLGQLDPEGRATVTRWVEVLGLDDWTQVPPLRALLPLVAIQCLVGSMEDDDLSATDRFLYAAERLGLVDDPDRATHPAEGYARTFRRWLSDASGQDVRPPEDRAA